MKKMNRTGKYFVFACAILILMNAFLGLLLTIQMSQGMTSLIRSRMLDISNTAAAMLDGDALAHIRAEDENTTTSSGLNLMDLCSPSAIRDRAANGSP